MTWMRPRMAARLGVAALTLALASPAAADTATFTTSENVALFNQGHASPYPSTLEVAGMQGALVDATLKLNRVDHASDLMDVLLVSPGGRTTMVLSDVPGNSAQADMTFSDHAAGPYPGGAVGTAGTYKPTDNDADAFNSDVFDPPAPAGPYGDALSALGGDSPNGTWKLFVLMNGEMFQSANGQIQGWSLTLTTYAVEQPPAQQPPMEQPKPPPTTPQVQSAAFTKPPVAGEAATFRVVASDTTHDVTGVVVDFGEKLGLWAESACVRGTSQAGAVTFDVPYTYLAPGPHTITLSVISGGCGQAEATTQTTTVTVNASKAARASAATTPDQAAPRAAKPGPCTGANAQPTPANAKLIGAALLCLMNVQRAKKRLQLLVSSPRLKRAAMFHSKAMVTGRFFAHQGPREAHLTVRLKRARYTGPAGENIGAGAGPLGSPAAMVRGWLRSPPHRKNLFHPKWRTVGIAFVPKFPLKTSDRPVATYTTDFGTKR